jgi:hypothetical protein
MSSPSWRYRVSGLALSSEVQLLSVPEASEETRPGEPEVTLSLGRDDATERIVGPWLLERRLEANTTPYLRVAGNPRRGYLLAHTAGLDLEVRDGGRRLVVTHLDPHLEAAEVEHLLLDQLLPLIMAQLGRLSLHASAVAIGGVAVALLAPSGVGKSTTAATLALREDATFFADDQVVLERGASGFIAHPSYPSVRLWDDAAAAVFRLPAGTGRKHHVSLRTVAHPVPLGALFLLEPGELLAVERLRPRDAVVGLAPHVDRLDPTDRASLLAELELLMALGKETPTFRAVIPRDLADVGAAADAITAAAGEARRGDEANRP